MEQNFNHVLLCGQVLTQPQPSHVNHGQSFSRFLLSVPRLSGQEDCLPVIVPQPLLELCPLSPGAAVTVRGRRHGAAALVQQPQRTGATAGGVGLCPDPPARRRGAGESHSAVRRAL